MLKISTSLFYEGKYWKNWRIPSFDKEQILSQSFLFLLQKNFKNKYTTTILVVPYYYNILWCQLGFKPATMGYNLRVSFNRSSWLDQCPYSRISCLFSYLPIWLTEAEYLHNSANIFYSFSVYKGNSICRNKN